MTIVFIHVTLSRSLIFPKSFMFYSYFLLLRRSHWSVQFGLLSVQDVRFRKRGQINK